MHLYVDLNLSITKQHLHQKHGTPPSSSVCGVYDKITHIVLFKKWKNEKGQDLRNDGNRCR